jgi:hypothetical protein
MSMAQKRSLVGDRVSDPAAGAAFVPPNCAKYCVKLFGADWNPGDDGARFSKERDGRDAG